MKVNLRVFGLLAAVVLGTTTAPAQGPPAASAAKDCNAYGIAALGDAKANQDSACNFTGPRWSTDANFHVQWCNAGNTTNQNLQSEGATRKKMLDTCATSQMMWRGIENIEIQISPSGKKGYVSGAIQKACSGNRKLMFWALTRFRCGTSSYKCEDGFVKASRWDERTLRCEAQEDSNTDVEGTCTGWCL